jgi:hypothetical protein
MKTPVTKVSGVFSFALLRQESISCEFRKRYLMAIPPSTPYSFGLPKRLEENSGGYARNSEFSYGPERQRYKQVANRPGPGVSGWSETTISIDGLFERRITTANGIGNAPDYREYEIAPSDQEWRPATLQPLDPCRPKRCATPARL